MKICEEIDCQKKHKAYGWCQTHYRRWRNTGSPDLILPTGAKTRHGEGKNLTTEYIAWRSMRQRCLDKNSHAYGRYGGRGIKICERWSRYENFLADMGRKPPTMTLERVDNNRGYSPENCVWASRRTQNLSKSDATHITINNKTQSVTEWAEELNVQRRTIFARLYKGWAPEKAILTPVRKYNV